MGNFLPSLFRTDEVEIGVKTFSVDSREPCHFQLSATEITVVLEGQVVLGRHHLSIGDILVIEPGEHASFRSLTESKVLAIKFPSNPKDKVMCGVCAE